MMPGNVLDVTHFGETFEQIWLLLPDNTVIVFDNGAYSRDNSTLLDRGGFGFVTRFQINDSNEDFVRKHKDGWRGWMTTCRS